MNKTHVITLISLCFALSARAGQFEITTKTGNGADACVMKTKPTIVFGTNTTLAVKAISYSVKKAYLRFDLTELKGAKIKEATLVLTTAMHHANEQVIQVVGIKAGETWDENTLTWEHAPAGTVELGTFTSARGDKLSGATVTFSSPALVEFLNSNPLPTLILASTRGDQKDEAGFAAKEHKTLAPPALKIVTE
jgi:hypothetical protein